MAANTDKNPGCLSVFLSLFKPSTPQFVSFELPADAALPYRLRDDFLSPAELSFYKVLRTLMGERLTLLSKIRMADIFFVAQPNSNRSSFNKIAMLHLDFLICDTASMQPLLGIELDDSSHQRRDRQKRDQFVDQVFEAANLPLVHIPVQREYDAKALAHMLVPILRRRMNLSGPAQPENAPAAAPAEHSAPLCPKCGIPMVLRSVAHGQHQGKQFYGCSNYPRCHEMKPLPGETSA